MIKFKKPFIMLVLLIAIATYGFGIAHTAYAAASPTPITDKIDNPIGFDNLDDFLGHIANILLDIGVPIAAIMIAWGGWLRMTARADTEQVKQSNDTIKYAIVGLIILLLAQGIVATIRQILQVSN